MRKKESYVTTEVRGGGSMIHTPTHSLVIVFVKYNELFV